MNNQNKKDEKKSKIKSTLIMSKMQLDMINNAAKQFNELVKNIYDTWILETEELANTTPTWMDEIKKIVNGTYKEVTKICLKAGFYPSTIIGISISEILKEDTNLDVYLCNLIEKTTEDEQTIKKILQTFPAQKDIISESITLFKNKKYCLCILSLINIISNIFNERFENTDFEESKKIYIKISNKTKLENNYLIFSPYVFERSVNSLIISYRNEPQKYSSINYNRNAIIHGYVNDYGNKENCLRWFSVLINTYEIIHLLDNIDEKN